MAVPLPREGDRTDRELTRGRHVRGRGYEADCEKYSEAALRGWRVLRVTNGMVRDERALALLERALREERDSNRD
jgi:hypothetical protein